MAVRAPGVSHDQAMTLGAVYGCLRFISSTVGCMAVDVLREVDGRGVPVSPAPSVVARPSPHPQVSAAEWLGQIVCSMRARGNAFGLVTQMSATGWPAKIDVLDPARVAYERRGGVAKWWLSDESGGKRTEVQLWQDGGVLWHVPFGCPPGGVIGVDVISQAAVDLGLALAARQYGADFFWSGGHPTAVLQSEQVLVKEQAVGIMDRWDEATAARPRSPRVLGAGLTYTPLQVTPDQVSLLGVLSASVADVCRWFDVPPEEIGGSSGDSLTYANVEGRGLQALRKLTPTIRAVQDAWTDLLPRPQYVRLNPAVLLMTNEKAKIDTLAAAINGHLMVPNEGRDKLDLPPVEGGDQLAPFKSGNVKEEVQP